MSFGRSLQNAKKRSAQACRARYATILQAQADATLHNTHADEPSEKKKLKSIWETNNLESFLSIADDREAGYLAERNVRVVVGGAVHVVQRDRVIPFSDSRDWFQLSASLTIPKRPPWSYDLPAAELMRREKQMFLEWRRSLAGLEESNKVLLTPYEKNLEVWRQLWRVVERSDVLLEIVDARNPLAFRSQDFERYASNSTNKFGASKPVILLLNKADLLTENQRKAWASFFAARNEKFFFFSAKPLEKSAEYDAAADASVANGTQGEGSSGSSVNSGPESDGEAANHKHDDGIDVASVATDEDAQVSKLVKKKKEKSRHQSRKLRGAPVQYVNPYELEAERRKAKLAKAGAHSDRSSKPSKPETEEERHRSERLAALLRNQSAAPHRVVDPEELLDLLAMCRAECRIPDQDTPVVVGMVGYPNVGKSSTINALIGCKKVVVSATPGKTKHFQTLVIPNERRVMLCDCPGLVFPSFASTREHMICDGVLPIDTVKDYVTPVAVICQRIPRQVFEKFFSVSLLADDDVDDSASVADRLLNVVARRKGYMTDHDKPNRSKIAKELLKMYVDGVFVYANPPPGLHIPCPEEYAHLGPSVDTTEGDATAEPPVDEHGEEGEDDDGWEDISEAGEARALSDDNGDRRSQDDDREAVAPPMFFARPKGTGLTQAELFNIERNVFALQAAAASGPHRKKKRTNHQLEPEQGVIVDEDGEVELQLDSDDGIVLLEGAAVASQRKQKKEKGQSKRAMRREAKRAGVHLPAKAAAGVVPLGSTL